MTISRNNMVGCLDERRSEDLRADGHPLNGLDYVEFVRQLAAPPLRRFRLDATFLKPPTGLADDAELFTVIGGVRVVGLRVVDVEEDPGNPLRLRIFLDREGDFSTYVLRVVHPDIDPERSEARFSFKAGCPSEFDCRVRVECPPDTRHEPVLDYLAKDYQSFRRLMLDLIPERHPGWLERLPADLGMALVELLAYAGDALSYYQDAAATEGYLDTCLHRISAARHGRLIDYRMHDGRNAFTYVHFEAAPASDGVVPVEAKLLTRVGTALRGEDGAPPVVVSTDADFDADPALADVTVFETTAITRVTSAHNELRIHTWGDVECCLAAGAVEAYLFGLGRPDPESPDLTASSPTLSEGEYLLLEETRSPVTGATPDADPARRQVVRLVEVADAVDPAYRDILTGGELTPRTGVGDTPLPLQRVRWREEDGLAFPLCLSADTPETGPIDPVSVARGNVAPADHGRTIAERDLPLPRQNLGRRWPLASLPIDDAPLTHHPMPDEPEYAEDNRLREGRHDLERDVRAVMPAIVLDLHFPGGERERLEAARHLLDSGAYDQQFVTEVDDEGRATLRFGDDEYGRRPLGVERVVGRYRIGNGRRGNVGAGALVHIVEPTPAQLVDPADPDAGPATFASILRLHQPLPARLGTDPETIEEVRQLAPEAFRAVQFRAVTEADWEEVAMRHDGVAAAKALFRWTGSWHTVFVAVHPVDAANVVRLAGSAAALEPDFAAEIGAHLRDFKLAGYDIAVRAASYVPLEIDVRVCVGPGHFRGDVLEAVARVLSNRSFADGTRGLFHPLEFVFGEPVFLSRLYAAVEGVAGVDSATVTVFKRSWELAGEELDRGFIAIGDTEIARLDNDPNFPENGVLRLEAVGGSSA